MEKLENQLGDQHSESAGLLFESPSSASQSKATIQLKNIGRDYQQ